MKKRIKETENTLEEKEKELEKMKRNAIISKTRIEQLQSKTELQQEEISEYAVMEAVQDCDFKLFLSLLSQTIFLKSTFQTFDSFFKHIFSNNSGRIGP